MGEDDGFVHGGVELGDCSHWLVYQPKKDMLPESCDVEFNCLLSVADGKYWRNRRPYSRAVRHRGAPAFGVQVPSMTRKQPMVAIEILSGILQFAVHSLVQVFKNRHLERFGVFEMGR